MICDKPIFSHWALVLCVFGRGAFAACGRVVCGPCSAQTAPVPGYAAPERVCTHCAAQPSALAAAARHTCTALLVWLGCAETPEAGARRERRQLLVNGAVFTRQRGLLRSAQKLSVSLCEETLGLRCVPVEGSGGLLLGSGEDEYPLVDIGTCAAKGPNSAVLVLTSPLGAPLLELEAASPKACDAFALALQEALAELTEDSSRAGGGPRPVPHRTRQSAKAKAQHVKARGIELADRKQDAELRKAKYMKDGPRMKYTALAMAGALGSKDNARPRPAEGSEY